MRYTAILVLSALLLFDSSARATLPTTLTGTWKDVSAGEFGTITVTITKEEGSHIEGIVQLTGSKNCVKPIPFRGGVYHDRFSAVADTPGICGQGGKIAVEATKMHPQESSKHGDVSYYKGEFSYKWFGVIWRRGVFELRPKKQTEE